jgi:hypothetical protein
MFYEARLDPGWTLSDSNPLQGNHVGIVLCAFVSQLRLRPFKGLVVECEDFSWLFGPRALNTSTNCFKTRRLCNSGDVI